MSKQQFLATIRRNWGYWDGRQAHKNHWLDQLFKVERDGRIIHFDKQYALGFLDGWASTTD